MKRSIGLAMVLGLLFCLWSLAQAQAARIDAFTFFVPWRADELAEFFRTGRQRPDGFTVTGVRMTISISVLRGDSYIYYDHWEDGLEGYITSPEQETTEVWGDGDLINGSPPGIPSDILSAGDVISLTNVVPVPRNRAELFFDGGDNIVSTRGAIAVTVTAWPQPTDNILFADAWELYPTSRWDLNYVIPVGQNVPRPEGGFTTVSLNVQAAEDSTSVDLDLNADGTFENSIVLNEGEQFTQVSGVMAGARVQASAPVQVHLFTKDPASTWEARGYTVLPFDQWGNDYLAPRSSDSDYWLYNPNSTDLVVAVQTLAGTTAITIPANSAGRYPPLPAPVLSSRTGARFSSADGRPFYGVAALDADADQDWGYCLLPISDLTTQALVGWAPGNWPPPPGPQNGGTGFESRVYVTALTTTTINVDYESNGARTRSFTISPLEERDITDPVDFDMTSARLYTEDCTRFMAVWGQDESAPRALPSTDVGNNIAPLRAPSIQKSCEGRGVQNYCCDLALTQPYTVAFMLTANNAAAYDFQNVTVGDTLPPEFTYVAGSTRVGGLPIDDGGTFPLGGNGLNVGTIQGSDQVTITFEATTTMAGTFENRAQLVHYDTPCDSPADGRATIDMPPHLKAGFRVDAAPPEGVVRPGQVITFGVTITNTGSVTITHLPLWETYDTSCLTLRGASVTPDITDAGAITWADLLTGTSILSPNASANLFVSFTVNDPLPLGVDSTTTVFGSEWVQIGANEVENDPGGAPQPCTCNEATAPFTGTSQLNAECDCDCDKGVQVKIDTQPHVAADGIFTLIVDGQEWGNYPFKVEAHKPFDKWYGWADLELSEPPKDRKRHIIVRTDGGEGKCACQCEEKPCDLTIWLDADCETGTVRIYNPSHDAVDETITVTIDGKVVDSFSVRLEVGQTFEKKYTWANLGISLADGKPHKIEVQTKCGKKEVEVFCCTQPEIWATCWDGPVMRIHNPSAIAVEELVTVILDGKAVDSFPVRLEAGQTFEKKYTWTEMGLSSPVAERHTIEIQTRCGKITTEVDPCFLPETGISHPPTVPVWLLAALPILGLLATRMAHCRRE